MDTACNASLLSTACTLASWIVLREQDPPLATLGQACPARGLAQAGPAQAYDAAAFAVPPPPALAPTEIF